MLDEKAAYLSQPYNSQHNVVRSAMSDMLLAPIAISSLF